MASYRDRLAGLLLSKDYDGAIGLIGGTNKGIRTLMGLLYHQDELVRYRAVTCFGRLSMAEPELVRPRIWQLFYSLSEESSVVGWASAQAIGEVARVNPPVAQHSIRPVVHFMDDEELSHPSNRNTVQLEGSIWVIGNIADVEPALASEMGPVLMGLIADPEPRVRALAVWALCRIGYAQALDELKKAVGDPGEGLIYDGEDMVSVVVSELAENTIGKLSGGRKGCL